MIEYDAFDEEYGAHGNWHPDDHREFVRLLRMHRGDHAATIRACCENAIGGLDRLDIIAHARWHARREELAIRKRLAIQEWRQAKTIAAQAEKQAAERICALGAARTPAADRRCARDAGKLGREALRLRFHWQLEVVEVAVGELETLGKGLSNADFTK